MRPGHPEEGRLGAAVDGLHSRLIEAGESVPRLKEVLPDLVDEQVAVALLRRAVPAAFLDLVASSSPWSERPRVLARVALNPRAPRGLVLRLVSQLQWRDLADVAASPRVPAAARQRAETLILDGLRDMRLGDRVTLGRLATVKVLVALLDDDEPRVVDAALLNPRLREEDVVTAVRRDDAPPTLVRVAADSSRWSSSYAVRFALVLQPRTPLPIALLQISSLVPRDLRRVAAAADLRPLVRAAARSVLERGSSESNPRRLN